MISDIPKSIPKGSSVTFHWLVQNCIYLSKMEPEEASKILNMLVEEGSLAYNHGYYSRIEEWMKSSAL